MKQITFFSYKGGSGRTTTLFNTLPFLAKECNATKDHPLIIFDMDYRSAGITILFGEQDKYLAKDVEDFENGKKRSVQYILFDKERDFFVEDFEDLKKHFAVAVGNRAGVEDNDSILLIGANIHLEANEVSSKENNYRLGEMVEQLEELGASCIVYDSPAGTQISANSSVDNSDVIVCCMRPSYQFRETTFDYLGNYVHNNAANVNKRSFILLPTAVPIKDFLINGEYQVNNAFNDITTRINDLNLYAFRLNNLRGEDNLFIDASMITEGNIGIPEIERFKWNEKYNLYSLNNFNENELTELELYAMNRYNNLAKLIMFRTK
ncbi:MAG: hypothetical protein E7183_06595 [Erysipelotrichaceae bacterium]|nr:hypothetical protein [Erysipelotrichaceae bacterium]